MTTHLWPLLRFTGSSSDEIKEKYREIFLQTYVRASNGNQIIIKDWNGNRIHFVSGIFDHAFSEASDYRFGCGIHDVPFSLNRARRILWIKEVLSASAGTIERWGQMRKDSRGKLSKRRVLVVVEEKYVVVLEETEKGKELHFISAFPADVSYLGNIRRKGALIEIKNPSLNGD